MASARHSYEVRIYEVVNGKSVFLELAAARAEGLNLDEALAQARFIVAKTSRVIRSLGVSEQAQTRQRGPVTGSIVAVVHGSDRKAPTARRMNESRFTRGIPQKVSK